MRPLALWALVSCGLASCAVAHGESNSDTSASANAQGLPAGTIVTFKTKDRRFCMGVEDASAQLGRPIGRFLCGDDKAPNQRWRVERLGDQFRFRNVKSDKCIGVKDASTEPGAVIAQFPCKGGASSNQAWKLLGNGTNFVSEFRNMKSQLCLGGHTTEHKLTQIECNKPGFILEWRVVVR